MEEFMVGIYKFTNIVNGHSYIGQSRNIETRKKKHLQFAFNPNTPDYDGVFHRAIRKYGIENFQFEVLEECSCKCLNDREKYYIQQYNTLVPNGYNMVPGGYCAIGTKLSLYDIEDITDLLRNTNISNKDIAKLYGVTTSLICGINTGKRWKRDIDYPIRKTSWVGIVLDEKNVAQIINLIQTTNLSFSEIGEQFGVKDHCVSAINRGRTWRQENIEYPIRNSKFANKRYYS
jgi:group I intron endonuclease